MRFEYSPGGQEVTIERVELPYDDEVLSAAVVDVEVSRSLYENDPVLWVRSAIGVDTERGASFVTDRELADRLADGGFAEWDPKVAQSVRDYLHQKGFIGLRSTND